MLPFGIVLDRHLCGDPVERNIGLRAAQRLQCGLGDFGLPCHAGGGGQHAMGTDEIGALADALPREADRLVVITADEVGIGANPVIKSRKWIARAQPDRPPRGGVRLVPSPAIGQR